LGSFDRTNSFPRKIIYYEIRPWEVLLKVLRSRFTLALVFPLFSAVFAALANAQAPAIHKAQPPRSPATLEGNWAGSLQAGDAVFHLVLHVSKSPDGALKATIDSLDQGVYGIEITPLTQNDSDVRFSVPSVGVQFEGKFSAGHSGIEGTWSQGNVGIPLSFHRQAGGAGAKKPGDAVASVEGMWQAALEANGLRLRFQLHVTHDDEKHLVAALDSPDQGISGIPAVKVSQKINVFHFEIPLVQGVYEGTLNAAKTLISGNWTQGGITHNLNFQRSDQLVELVRPQTPKKPYPYREEEVTFANAKAQVSLAGTLTLPSGQGPFPAAILIAGSGPHDRDEDVVGHRPFLVLADHLTRKGIAVLRYDKRGIGKSTGNYDQATTEDFASDATAALDYLKSHREINSKKIGLIGHSEGGLIAPMIASHSSDVAWVVLLAAPGLKGEQIMLLQSELILKAAGFDDDRIAKARDFGLQSYALARKEKDPEVLETKLTELVDSTGMSTTLPPTTLKPQAKLMTSAWFRFFLDYDPIPALNKTQCPVLALNGDKDLQIASKENLAQIEKALQEGGNKDFQTHEFAGLNHLFQHAPTGSPTEYGGIQETFAPEALTSVSDWILKHTAP
jgi:pimeloyl-ACP methyl ester carboxylesterase